MEYSMNYQQAADKTGLQPIVDMSSPSEINKQVSMCSLFNEWTAICDF